MFSSLSYKKTNQFNSLINNYLNKESYTKKLYGYYPNLKNIQKQAEEKLAHYSHRETLLSVLWKQNQKLDLSDKQKENLEHLVKQNVATITTGHQLNLLTGPIYFLYKILQTIKLCDELNKTQKKTHFVPVFWMASEDHDWAEVNHFYYKQEKIEWQKECKGSVGDISNEGMEAVLLGFLSEIKNKKFVVEFESLLKKSYFDKSCTYAESTRRLVHELFKAYGLIILDGNEKELKQLAIPYFSDEILSKSVLRNISQTNVTLTKKEVQAHARTINLFYKTHNLRERIIESKTGFQVNHHPEISFNQKEILYLLQNEPEKFSPNVLMRPLYQEIILPNVAYIGGAGEISYWLQLKAYFDSHKIPFPVLIPRNSIVWVTPKQIKKMEALKISFDELFLSSDDLINKKIKENYSVEIDFQKIRNEIQVLYDFLYKKAKKTDKTFGYLLEAQKVRQLKGVDALEKRLLKAEKIKHYDITERIKKIKQALFPFGTLQERTLNFVELYLDYGPEIIDQMYESISPVEFVCHIKSFN